MVLCIICDITRYNQHVSRSHAAANASRHYVTVFRVVR